MRPSTWKVNPTTNKIIGSNFAKTTLESVPVCCLAEIPVEHLSYHAKRYGKIGIGFHRDAAIRCGFNPVFYQLHTSDVLFRTFMRDCSTKEDGSMRFGVCNCWVEIQTRKASEHGA